MIDLSLEHLELLKRILREKAPECRARIFGSRVNGNSKKYSDIDIALSGDHKIDWRKMEEIKLAFSESHLPFLVDVVDWNDVSETFREKVNEKESFELL